MGVWYSLRNTLPEPAKSSAPLHYDSNNQVLYSPIWALGPKHNMDFVNAAVKAVGAVKVGCFPIISMVAIEHMSSGRRDSWQWWREHSECCHDLLPSNV